METVWEWRQNYRVWEASRKVFLYPENWVEPELRPASRTQIQLNEVVAVAHAQPTSVPLTSAKPAATLLAGRVLAAGLGREFYRVDVTTVVSTYIGETEKHLDLVFAAVDPARVVLLLDEADALFGKQSESGSSHDRFANAKVSDLLKRIEAFDGLAVVATSATRDSVAALLRRFAFVLDPPA